jgi:mRNA interferase RelE/StbE
LKEIIWSAAGLDDLAAVDRATAVRIKNAIERFASSGVGDIKQLQGISPPEHRLRVGDWRVRFQLSGNTMRILRVRNRREAYR